MSLPARQRAALSSRAAYSLVGGALAALWRSRFGDLDLVVEARLVERRAILGAVQDDGDVVRRRRARSGRGRASRELACSLAVRDLDHRQRATCGRRRLGDRGRRHDKLASVPSPGDPAHLDGERARLEHGKPDATSLAPNSSGDRGDLVARRVEDGDVPVGATRSARRSDRPCRSRRGGRAGHGGVSSTTPRPRRRPPLEAASVDALGNADASRSRREGPPEALRLPAPWRSPPPRQADPEGGGTRPTAIAGTVAHAQIRHESTLLPANPHFQPNQDRSAGGKCAGSRWPAVRMPAPSACAPRPAAARCRRRCPAARRRTSCRGPRRS